MTTRKKSGPAVKKKAPAKALAPRKTKEVTGAKAGKGANKQAGQRDALDDLATRLGLTRAQAEARAIEALASRGSVPKKPSGERAPGEGPLPRRLYLLLDGRGLDGRGMAVEVIDLPTIVGSGKSCSVWVNSPQIETRHLQIWRDGESWLLEDLGTEKGTFLNDLRIKRRLVQHGDEYRLAGYLRLRTEFR